MEIVTAPHGPDPSSSLHVWMQPRDEAFEVDQSYVVRPTDTTIVMAARRDYRGIWHDVTATDVERVIDALRWLVVRRTLDDRAA